MRRPLTTALGAGLALLLGIAAPAAAQAPGASPGRTFTVTTTSDTTDADPGNGRCADSAGRCSLRAAVMEADALTGTTTIALARRATYPLTLTGSGTDTAASGDLDITRDVTIAGNLVVNQTRTYSNSAARAGGNIETVAGTVDVDGGLLWTGAAGPMPGNGGAIHTSGAGDVEVRGVSVAANTATNEGGGLWSSAVGTMRVEDSDLVGNSADGTMADSGGGGLFNQGNADGTGGGTLTVTGSTVWANTATNGSASGGGILNETGTLSVTDTTIIGNSSARAGGGIEVVGGTTGLAGTTTLSGVRLLDNDTGAMPGNGGGLHLGGAGTVTIDASRVEDSSAANGGGGLWNSPSGIMTVTGTSIVGNTVGVTGNGANVFQKGPVTTGVFTVDGQLIAEGPNPLAFP